MSIVPPRRPARRPASGLLPRAAVLVVFIGIGVVPLALVAIWSFWSFDPDTYWIKPVWSLASYAALLEDRAIAGLRPHHRPGRITAAASHLLAFPAATVIGLMSGRGARRCSSCSSPFLLHQRA